jgi:hypothetical protein
MRRQLYFLSGALTRSTSVENKYDEAARASCSTLADTTIAYPTAFARLISSHNAREIILLRPGRKISARVMLTTILVKAI